MSVSELSLSRGIPPSSAQTLNCPTLGGQMNEAAKAYEAAVESSQSSLWDVAAVAVVLGLVVLFLAAA